MILVKVFVAVTVTVTTRWLPPHTVAGAAVQLTDPPNKAESVAH